MSEVIFTDATFEAQALKSDKPVLVDFFADWCGPCKIQGPIVEELATDMGDKAVVGKLDVDANPETAQKYGVLSIPTIIIFKDGKEVEKIVGVQQKDALAEKLNNLA
jgi:thioredoxin 1